MTTTRHSIFDQSASRAEAAVMGHYGSEGLIARVFDALRAAGIDPDAMGPDDLVPLEHMHTGGINATRRVLSALRPEPGQHLVDIGCGIGGVARAAARGHGARVTGIDLTTDFVELATELSRRTGLGQLTGFLVGSALRLPLAECSADCAVLMHVGMNIEDKERMFSEAFRILRPGGKLALCDIMLGPLAEPLAYPVPWAATAETSHLATPEAYRDLAVDAGFAPISELDYYTETLSAAPIARAEPGFQPLGPHLLMGPDARRKIANHRANLDAGRVLPVQMVFARP
ncbi:class I SAM-dependent methyltransferase [Halovulum dunhuangense]|uniref:Class I SAM-dependent methyltransferase n=1 Tax=Halovulum dunhuangense TaxID=1505036 RepID=A0A849KV32_9RHOB|nr:class I SAM-dependent methyltransferase [Halovulum dunhuangense]NNU79501.1 class I SAM-dependent methyltransferase [Halovulum dunhuangense]